jgi:hypothetical protein
VTIRVNQTPLANKGDCKEILLWSLWKKLCESAEFFW